MPPSILVLGGFFFICIVKTENIIWSFVRILRVSNQASDWNWNCASTTVMHQTSQVFVVWELDVYSRFETLLTRSFAFSRCWLQQNSLPPQNVKRRRSFLHLMWMDVHKPRHRKPRMVLFFIATFKRHMHKTNSLLFSLFHSLLWVFYVLSLRTQHLFITGSDWEFVRVNACNFWSVFVFYSFFFFFFFLRVGGPISHKHGKTKQGEGSSSSCEPSVCAPHSVAAIHFVVLHTHSTRTPPPRVRRLISNFQVTPPWPKSWSHITHGAGATWRGCLRKKDFWDFYLVQTYSARASK